MAALEVNDTLFGAKGVSDLGVFTPTVAYRREIDFAKSNAAASTNYSVLPLPKGFVLTGAAVETVEACDGTSNTITLKIKSDASASAIVSAQSVTAAGIAVSTTAKAFTAADTLCFVMAAATTKGKVAVTLTGYFVNEETMSTASAPGAWRARLQTVDNVSGGQLDPRVKA